MESESKNIIQMLKNVKQIIEVSKERGCWKDEELKDIGITYHNVCEILRQLQAKQTQDKQFEEITEDPVLEEPEPEQEEPMEEVN
jgi:hypothetical protein